MFGYFKERKRRRQAERFQCGYDYAAGRLVESGGYEVEDLEAQSSCAKTFGEYDDFDRGVAQAIIDFDKLVRPQSVQKTMDLSVNIERFVNTLK